VSYIRKTIDELTPRFDGVVRLARKDLGITAFGCQVFELPPNAAAPRHSESATGQQELYVNLDGRGWIEIDGHDVEFGQRTLIHVAPEATRQPCAGADGLTYLCVGGVPETTFRPNIKFD
jgi:hypothetical protein